MQNGQWENMFLETHMFMPITVELPYYNWYLWIFFTKLSAYNKLKKNCVYVYCS